MDYFEGPLRDRYVKCDQELSTISRTLFDQVNFTLEGDIFLLNLQRLCEIRLIHNRFYSLRLILVGFIFLYGWGFSLLWPGFATSPSFTM